MFTYLFFDDQKLYRRDGLERKTVCPEILSDSVYYDGLSSTDLRTPFVFKTDDGKYRMIYQGRLADKSDYCFIAVSDDGIHFTPEDVSEKVEIENRIAPHELFKIEGAEIAEIIEDNKNDPAERYKMLYCDIDGANLKVHGNILASPDLIHWKKLEGEEWNADGAEPISGVFYNKEKECFTIIVRPDWGVRKIGYTDTSDWKTFSSYEKCLQVDSLDEPLCELYGMPSFEYEGYYIGMPLMYSNITGANNSKFHGGTMYAQLAYSFDGHHWLRGPRTPFITGLNADSEKIFGYKNSMVWPSCALRLDNGDTYIYTSVTKEEHGPAFANPGHGRICIYKVTKDRFIELATAKDCEGIISTRENIWHSGELHINLNCEKATLAVFESKGDDILGYAHDIEGFSHEDCIPFSGDSTDWIPQFKNGKTLDSLKGKVLIFEIKLQNGSIFSMSGDLSPVMNLQAGRYRKFGIMPDKIL